MAGFFIESVKSGMGNGGMACGPVPGPIVAEAKVRTENGGEFYVSLSEVDGLPNFFKTDRSTFDEQLADDYEDDLIEYLEENYIETGEYDDIFRDKDPEWYPLLRYLIYIVRAGWNEFEKYADLVVNQYADKLEIPMSDLEQEYLEEQ